MYCNQIFSLIDNTGAVKNVIVADNYTVANDIAVATYGTGSMAVDTTLYPVSIGYTYTDGIFYDTNSNTVNRNPTEAEQIAALTSALDAANSKVTEQQIALDAITQDILPSLVEMIPV